jgi:hypothetical protein
VEWWRNGTAELLIWHRLDELVKPLTLFKLVIDDTHPNRNSNEASGSGTPDKRSVLGGSAEADPYGQLGQGVRGKTRAASVG